MLTYSGLESAVVGLEETTACFRFISIGDYTLRAGLVLRTTAVPRVAVGFSCKPG